MRCGRLWAWLAGVGLLLAVVPARAVMVSGDFGGVIVLAGMDANDTLGLGNDLTGQTISGHIAYETTLAPTDSDPSTSVAEYHTPSLTPQWLTVTGLRIGGVALPLALTPAPAGSTDQSAQTVSFQMDGASFGIAYQDAYQAATGEFVGLTLGLSLVAGPPFASQALPLFLDAADFTAPLFPTSTFALSDPLASNPIDVQGAFVVTQLQLAPAGVPEPGALALLGLGMVGLKVRLLRHRPRR